MRATLMYAADDVRVEDVIDPRIHRPTNAVVRIVLSCIAAATCGRTSRRPPRTTPATQGLLEAVGPVPAYEPAF
ncbi:hypothetical protein SAMN05216223_113196 [Actinacidiphila yanglinensis]|uniref:Uncharacterized protein n=1 Tax=Actinacidiphila yanglinensis TaxID=310779 RepID=A0A1H6DBP7_9ACTN|nr:hypothetical protein SAMN05216223_113196 [Actinacidiphila yanglinensis]